MCAVKQWCSSAHAYPTHALALALAVAVSPFISLYLSLSFSLSLSLSLFLSLALSLSFALSLFLLSLSLFSLSLFFLSLAFLPFEKSSCAYSRLLTRWTSCSTSLSSCERLCPPRRRLYYRCKSRTLHHTSYPMPAYTTLCPPIPPMPA